MVEVADTTLALDRGKKLKAYARAGVEDYWIVNLVDRQVEVHRGPRRSPGKLGWVQREASRLGARARGAECGDLGGKLPAVGIIMDMTRSSRKVFESALKLSQSERAQLAQEIFDSLDDEYQGDLELDPVYRAELERRALDEPAPGERWPTAKEVVDAIRANRPPARRKKKRA